MNNMNCLQGEKVLLSCIEYTVSEVDGQIMFHCSDGFGSGHITIEWNGCGWELLSYERDHKMFLSHVLEAYKWVQENYRIEWDNGTGVAKFKG